jgi:hypothetical protein
VAEEGNNGGQKLWIKTITTMATANSVNTHNVRLIDWGFTPGHERRDGDDRAGQPEHGGSHLLRVAGVPTKQGDPESATDDKDRPAHLLPESFERIGQQVLALTHRPPPHSLKNTAQPAPPAFHQRRLTPGI